MWHELVATLLASTINIAPTPTNALQIDSLSEVTAESRDAWLVLYRADDADSAFWADEFTRLNGVPTENLLALDAPATETISFDQARDLFNAVRGHIDSMPNGDRIIGIVLGYGLPGRYTGNGGSTAKSIANALQDLNNETREQNALNALALGGLPERLTRASMPDGHYLVTRIDAPDPLTAVAMTLSAIVVRDGGLCLASDPQEIAASAPRVYYDFSAPELAFDEWTWLKNAVGTPEERPLPEVPWVEFQAEQEQTPFDAFRFGTYGLNNWGRDFDSLQRLYSPEAGPRILAYNMNSFGMSTLRDPNADGGRYCVSAIAAGYASAIGATDEPFSQLGPFPGVLLEALRDGRTIAEAMYLAVLEDDWVWTLTGDPFLSLNTWFDDECLVLSGDTDCDGVITAFDINGFILALLDPEAYIETFPDCDILSADLNGDGVVNTSDIDAFIEALLNA